MTTFLRTNQMSTSSDCAIAFSAMFMEYSRAAHVRTLEATYAPMSNVIAWYPATKLMTKQILLTISSAFPKVFITNGDEKERPMNANGMQKSNQKFQRTKERIRMAPATRTGAFTANKYTSFSVLVPKISLVSASKRVRSWTCPLLCASRNSE